MGERPLAVMCSTGFSLAREPVLHSSFVLEGLLSERFVGQDAARIGQGEGVARNRESGD